MMTILLTGFEPFDGEPINPSKNAVTAVAAERHVGYRLVHAILPTTYDGAIPHLRAAVERHSPDVVISVGQAGGRPEISVERVAINIDDGRIPDNGGMRRIDQPVVPGGPAAYFATLPIKATVAAIRSAGIPVQVSQSAGTFLCNHVFYAACHIAATERPGMRVGFIHVPFLPEQAARRGAVASMCHDQIISALRIAVAIVRDREADLVIAEGATH
jgi:pyroglutamyl-peptidase